MNNSNIVPLNTISMSTREIAELTGKQHRNVVRDLKKQFEALGIDVLRFEHIYLDQYGREQTEYMLDRIQTMNLVTGYSVIMRDKVNRRWLELESSENSKLMALITAVGDVAKVGADNSKAITALIVDQRRYQDRCDQRFDELQAQVNLKTDNKNVYSIVSSQILADQEVSRLSDEESRLGKPKKRAKSSVGFVSAAQFLADQNGTRILPYKLASVCRGLCDDGDIEYRWDDEIYEATGRRKHLKFKRASLAAAYKQMIQPSLPM